MKRFNLNFLIIIGIAFALFYFFFIMGSGIEVYAQEPTCCESQQQIEGLSCSIQEKSDSDEEQKKLREEKYKEALLASIMDDLYWLFIIACVAAFFDALTLERTD